MQSESDSHWDGFFSELALIVAGLLVYRARSALMARFSYKFDTVVANC